MDHVAGLRCVACDHEIAWPTPAHVCPRCGGNTEVRYELARVRRLWMRGGPHANGRPDIWRYRPLLPVAPTDDAGLARVRVGWTPLYRAERLGAHFGLQTLYVKDDGLNPSASFKDRATAVVLARAVADGHALVVGASTGNAGSSLACLAASLGVRAMLFVPRTAPQAKIAQLLAFGAQVFAVDGSYDQAFDLCLEVARERGWLSRSTGINPFTREGKKTCALEIVEQLGWQVPDYVAVSVGDGNIISGLWKGFSDLYELGLIERRPRLIAVQSQLSNAVARSVQALRAAGAGGAKPDWTRVQVATVQATTVADSISVDLPRDGLAAVRAVVESEGFAIEVSDDDILQTIPLLARAQGVFGEPAGVASVTGVRAAAAAGLIDPTASVVCVVTGNGLKDVKAAIRVAGEPVGIAPTAAAFAAAYRG